VLTQIQSIGRPWDTERSIAIPPDQLTDRLELAIRKSGQAGQKLEN